MEDRKIEIVYEQYWLHARHSDNNTWLFTSTYSVIIGAIIAIVGANIARDVKIGLAAFGTILSLLGFGVVYVNRVPFLKYVMIAELIAINEFKIKDEYRRFFPKDGKTFPKDKWFDLHDVLSTFYSLLAGAMIYLCIRLCFDGLACALFAATVVIVSLIIIHFRIIRPIKYIKEISEELEKRINTPDGTIRKNI